MPGAQARPLPRMGRRTSWAAALSKLAVVASALQLQLLAVARPAAGAHALAAGSAKPAAKPKPNVLLIVADDQGWAQVRHPQPLPCSPSLAVHAPPMFDHHTAASPLLPVALL